MDCNNALLKGFYESVKNIKLIENDHSNFATKVQPL